MRLALILVSTALLVGCGGGGVTRHQAATKTHPLKREKRACSPATLAGEEFRTCFTPSTSKERPTIERRVGALWKVVAEPLKPFDPTAGWGRVWLSPDRKTLLAEWLYACDGRVAVFVPADDGRPRIVTGERNWTRAAASDPLGWTKSGKARVRIYDHWGPGRRRRPGSYLFDLRNSVATPLAPARGC